MNMKLELVGVPVSDIDRAKDFYVKAGFHADVVQTAVGFEAENEIED